MRFTTMIDCTTPPCGLESTWFYASLRAAAAQVRAAAGGHEGAGHEIREVHPGERLEAPARRHESQGRAPGLGPEGAFYFLRKNPTRAGTELSSFVNLLQD